MKSDNRKSTAPGKSGKHTSEVAPQAPVADAEYASQMLEAAEALNVDTTTQVTASATDASNEDDAPGLLVVLPAQCLMRDAVELKSQLLSRLDTADAVQIDVAKLERIDAAAMQVLVAFVIDRADQEHNVEWCGVNAVLREAAKVLGLESALRLPALEQAA